MATLVIEENNNGKNIKKSGWWCFSFTATATGAYGKKFPTNEATFGVIIGFKLLSGSTTSLKTLLSSKERRWAKQKHVIHLIMLSRLAFQTLLVFQMPAERGAKHVQTKRLRLEN